MGNKNKNRERFLAEHKFCCFCGGQTLAEEEDHFPSRAIFDNRQWPEGYSFPACIPCNRQSRKEEAVIAFLSRIFGYGDNTNTTDIIKHARSLEYNYPGILDKIQLTANEKRKAIKKYNIELPFGNAKGDAPLIRADDPTFHNAVTIFARKLLLALYYKHISIPLTHNGGVVFRWYTNLQATKGDIPEELYRSIPGTPILERCNTSLIDQFFYKYGITECKGGSVFLISFRKSFYIVGFVYSSKERITNPRTEILGPFNQNN